MSGRPAIPVYQYNEKGEYLRRYDNQREVFTKYFDGKVGRLFDNPHYRELPDGTFISTYRIGRLGLMTRLKIDRDPYCKKHDNKAFSIYNRIGEKMASFSSLRQASLLTGKSTSEIHSRIYRRDFKFTRDGLYYQLDES